MKKLALLAMVLCFMHFNIVQAQSQLPNQEVRAVWLTTVYNLDWPIGGELSESYKKNELSNYLIKLKEAGINTIYFQVRTSGDAVYYSELEPWSKYFTGKEGRAPDPFWDPLEFAVEEAHKLGMELHAWVNPYRAMSTIPGDFSQDKVQVDNEVDESLIPFQNKYAGAETGKYKGTTDRDTLHVANKHPEWLLVLRNSSGARDIAIFDPGLQEVRDYVSSVITDIVTRYDVDGVHFDDYFYPYPENGMKLSYNSSLDDSSFALNPRGFTDKKAWRRDNIDIFIKQVNDSIKTAKPWVKFGISPFGIYKNGIPFGITGLNAYEELYIDPLKWAEEGDVDYLMPQLYWKFGGGQDFEKLSKWWAKEVGEKRGRHFYPGTAPYRADNSTRGSSALFKADEIPRQIQFTRDHDYMGGVSFFRMKNITTHKTQGLVDSLKTNYYRRPAIIPTMDWLDTSVPETPTNISLAIDAEQGNKITLAWDKADDAILPKLKDGNEVDTLRYYAIYRVDSDVAPNPEEVISNPENRIEITGETSFTDIAEPSSEGNYYYVVTAVSRNGVESLPSDPIDAGQVVPNELQPELATEYSLEQNYPNPFNPTTNIRFTLGSTGMAKLTVYDVLGREVATLLNEKMTVGRHEINFDASSLSSGVYIYKLESNGVNLTKKFTLIK